VTRTGYRGTAVPRDTGAKFYASPDGTPAGDGSIAHPWDIVTALAQPSTIVPPGSTIWVRGGTYGTGTTIFHSSLVGTPSAPIVVRQYPGERAIINGWLQIGCCDQDPHPDQGAYVWFWGLEFASSITDRTGSPAGPPDYGASAILNAVDSWAPGTRLINLIIHDTRQGVGFWKEATNSEVYGCLIYNNGFQASDRGHGHGIYVQNNNGTKLLAENIIFDQFGVGIHAYGTDQTYIRNITAEGNIVFNNGSVSTGGQNDDNILFASGTGLQNIVVRNNYTYHTPDNDITGIAPYLPAIPSIPRPSYLPISTSFPPKIRPVILGTAILTTVRAASTTPRMKPPGRAGRVTASIGIASSPAAGPPAPGFLPARIGTSPAAAISSSIIGA